MRGIRLAAALGVAAMAGAGPSLAQSFDCAKARTAVENGICASAVLKGHDLALAALYAAVFALDPARTSEIAAGQRQWVHERDWACAPKPGAPADAGALTSCLDRVYRARLAGLNAEAIRATAASLPSSRPQASASLDRETTPAMGAHDVMLQVREAGRFSIRAESASGVSLQLVDMIQGPGETAGEPGVRDGRLDVLLDVGTYKLRVAGAPNASGDAKLSVSPFREPDAASTALLQGGAVSTDLADLQQRSFWIAVPKPGKVSVEAAGRSLADLRLWRNGADLADLAPGLRPIEPKAGRPLWHARLEGTVEPGIYLATAYGGAPLSWADGDAAQPLHVRAGEPPALVGGWAEGQVGPLGVVRFALPQAASYLRLELPEPTAARITVARGRETLGSAEISKRSREPVAEVRPAARDGRVVEVAAAEGRPFRLRALQPAGSRNITGSGPHWIAVDVAGEGADEIPVTALLGRFDGKGGATVLASDMPRIGQGQAWRRRFNLRGPSTILFEAAGPTPVAIRAEGVGARFAIEPLLGRPAPRADGRQRHRWDLEAGWYMLKIEPADNAVGVLDLTIGPPGLLPEPSRPAAPRLALSFGVHTLAKDMNHVILANNAPGLVTAPVARPLPADLEQGALTLPQNTGQAHEVMVRLPARGELLATDTTGAPVAVSRVREAVEDKGRGMIVRVPAPDRPRTVILAWSDPPSAADAPRYERPGPLPTVQAGRPQFFDLAADEQKSFALEVREGGLYRVETLGRLQMRARVGTAFIPELDSGEANGAGGNALVQTYLRAGRYRVAVSASESAGRAGLTARPAPLIEGARLTPGGSVRASLAGGAGAVFPIEIAEAGAYRLELLGLGRVLSARLEDAEGWPLTEPGELRRLEQRFEPGRYRLVVLPEAVDVQAVARLQKVETAAPPQGRGPHALVFDSVQQHQWREPQGLSDPRVPDRWAFALQGPAEVVLDIGDGMTGELKRSDAAGEAAIARIVHKNGFSGRLGAGRYVVEARSLGRNDRLDYTIALRTKELQPGRLRRVSLPATIPFALGEDRVVNLTTFGSVDVRGVLKDAGGEVIEGLDDRADDWNVALSRHLPAGAYTLELSAVAGQRPARPEEGSENQEASSGAEGETETASDASAPEAEDDGRIEVSLALPDAKDGPALGLVGAATAAGPEVHRFALPPVAPGVLTVIAATSDAELVLALERQDAACRWRTVGQDRGKSAVVAAPTDGERRPWRASVWAVDGGASPVVVSARSVERGAQRADGEVALGPVPFDEVGVAVRVGLVESPGAGLLALEGETAGLSEGSVGGQALVPAGELIAPQSERLWLLSRGERAIRLKTVPEGADRLALTIAPAAVATLPAPNPRRDALRFWQADSTFGQPGLDGGRGAGVAKGSALALADKPLRVFNAGGADRLRVSLVRTDVALREATDLAAGASPVLAPATAQPLRLPAGPKRLALALPPGTAAVANWNGADAVTVWSGSEAVSRAIEGDWTELLLVNLTAAPAPVSVALAPIQGEPTRLAAGQVLKRFVGAAGSFALPVGGEAGDRLLVGGARATFVAQSGRVLRGSTLVLPGPGTLILEHEPGLVAAWVEREGRSLWPAATARPARMPEVVALEGPAMALALDAEAPRLLHVRTTAPVMVALQRKGEGPEPPAMFPAGAEFHRYQPAGAAELRLYSPHDGALGGTLAVTATPIVPVGEGIGAPMAVAPGGTALFGFEVTQAARVGVGIRAEPDQVAVRLLDAQGRGLGEGVAQLHRLEPGRYVLEARIPAEGVAGTVRPTVLGIAPPPAGPPQEVTLKYLEMVGLAPNPTR